jgi:hypothetical protein
LLSIKRSNKTCFSSIASKLSGNPHIHTHGREKSYFFDNNEPLNPDFIFSISLLVEKRWSFFVPSLFPPRHHHHHHRLFMYSSGLFFPPKRSSRAL